MIKWRKNEVCPFCESEFDIVKLNGLNFLYCDSCNEKDGDYKKFFDTRGYLVSLRDEDIEVFESKVKSYRIDKQ